MTVLIGRLAAGPLDVVGDVHGEMEALEALLMHLGYRPDGTHPEDRRLVFVGDLVDRGHDSPAVVHKVRQLVESGIAQAVLGNHELNLLRGSHKEGNGWFFDDPAHRDREHGKFLSSAQADDQDRAALLNFLASLPVALEREDIRIVHACWDGSAVSRLIETGDGVRVEFDRFEQAIHCELEADGTAARAKLEDDQSKHWLRDRGAIPEWLPNLARREATKQMGNPLRVLTSGVERETTAPFFSSGEWRFVERVRWWDEYQETVPVIVGHYWRWAAEVDRASVDKGGPDLFEGLGITEWHGARRNVLCVDYSVGRRFLDRELEQPYSPACRLGALRWPEREVVFDDGERVPTTGGPSG